MVRSELLKNLAPGVVFAVPGLKRAQLLAEVQCVERNDVEFEVQNVLIWQSDTEPPVKGAAVQALSVNTTAKRRSDVIDSLKPGQSVKFHVPDRRVYFSVKNAVRYRVVRGEKVSTKSIDKHTMEVYRDA